MPRGVYDRSKIAKGDPESIVEVERVEAVEAPKENDNNAMNELARRIWDGQSVDLPLNERTRRIVRALKDKGFDVAGLSLPNPGFRKYL